VTLKAELLWQAVDNPRCKLWRAIVSHGCYEVRAYRPKRWRCYRDGTLLWAEFFISRNAAIARIEDSYYDDPKQLSATLNIRRKNARSNN
jgi:hypothetical protein